VCVIAFFLPNCGGFGWGFLFGNLLGFRRRVPDCLVLLVDDVRISQGGRSCVLFGQSVCGHAPYPTDNRQTKAQKWVLFISKQNMTNLFFEFGAPFR
jgi:hypothetical protein